MGRRASKRAAQFLRACRAGRARVERDEEEGDGGAAGAWLDGEEEGGNKREEHAMCDWTASTRIASNLSGAVGGHYALEAFCVAGI